jgi:hypothetical protein
VYQDRERRQIVDIPCELVSVGRVSAGRVRDLSTGGCRLLSPHLGSDQERLMISISAPGLLPEIQVVAETRWSDLTSNRDLYFLGCRFLHAEQTPGLIRQLLEAIETTRLTDPERRPGDHARRFERS